MNIGYDYCIKCVVIGEAFSGKTSFVKRLCDNNYTENYEPTIGVEFNTYFKSHFSETEVIWVGLL